jgi:peptide/nickel transport system permease protein
MVAQMIIVESAMSFLGLGVEPPQASWGSMLHDAQEMMAHFPRLVALPGTLILATVFGFNLLGEGLRDAFDPQS